MAHRSPRRGLEHSDDAHPRRPARCCCSCPPPRRRGRATRTARFGRRGTVTLKATDADAVGGAVKVLSGNRVLAGGAAAGQFVVRAAARDRHARQHASAPAARSSRRCRARRSTACARSPTFRDGRIVAAGTLRRPTAATRIVARPAAADRRDRPELRRRARLRARRPGRARSSARWRWTRNGNVILAGSRGRRRRADRDPAAAPTARPDPAFGAGGTVDGAALGLAGRVDRRCSCARDGTLTFTVGGGRPRRSATFTVVRAAGRPARPTRRFGGTGVVTRRRSGPGTGAGLGRGRDPPGPVEHDAGRGHRPDAPRGTPRGAVIRLQRRRHARHALRHARASRASRAPAATSGSRRWPATAAAGSCSPAPAAPPDALVVRLRASGAPRHHVRQRRPHLPAARPPARRRPDLHDARRDRRRRLAAPSSPARPPARARCPQRLGGTTYTRPLRAHRLAIAVTRSCSQGTCGSCSGFISTLRRTRTPSASISTSGCAAANARAVDPQRATGRPGRRRPCRRRARAALAASISTRATAVGK